MNNVVNDCLFLGRVARPVRHGLSKTGLDIAIFELAVTNDDDGSEYNTVIRCVAPGPWAYFAASTLKPGNWVFVKATAFNVVKVDDDGNKDGTEIRFICNYIRVMRSLQSKKRKTDSLETLAKRKKWTEFMTVAVQMAREGQEKLAEARAKKEAEEAERLKVPEPKKRRVHKDEV